MTTEHERRQFQRIDFDAPVSLEQNGQTWNTSILDISLKGILIASANIALDQQQAVNISIELSTETHIDMVAQWSHSRNDTSGFFWTGVDIDSLSHLRRLLELNTSDEELLHRELGQLSSL